jgi:hypothetical protein
MAEQFFSALGTLPFELGLSDRESTTVLCRNDDLDRMSFP